MKTMIFKVQRPIGCSDKYGRELLIYNEDRTIDAMYTASKKEMKQLFPNDEYKTYWKGKVDMKNRQFYFTEQVGEQQW